MAKSSVILWVLVSSATAWAQDQQLGARTKAMGGSYTAFEDDPVSVWLNPAGIATQSTSLSIAYQTYTTYPLHEHSANANSAPTFSAGATTTFVNPAFVPSYLGLVFHIGAPDSGLAGGICYAQPYHLNYSFDKVDDPTLKNLIPDSNVDQSFSRFRVALAKDFRISPVGEAGWLTHVSVGGGLDLGYTRWEFKSDAVNSSDNLTAFGGGVGCLLGIYDNMDNFKWNLGVAYQSAVNWRFNISPSILPSFDMPQQLNAGLTFYLLKDQLLRVTLDTQWIEWSSTAASPLFPGDKSFRDAINYSIGFEYRVPVPAEGINLYPRAGFRRFEAPWSDRHNLPAVTDYRLVLDTKGSTFNIFTLGLGLSWASEQGKIRSVDLAGDLGGDSYNLAVGFNFEF